ncbi:MAG: energy transducer TonB [Neisseria zoodegmatis]|uniref:energy transducer TonB n=1 Tax=Neisseria zoodegmatis TaxID=326523 RepID=UPI0026EAEB09|nr:energy transducer TonB [Neisseria zoodegmatis]MDO5069370.1 energy transducer TonB [Neisseria zoodegmatis]
MKKHLYILWGMMAAGVSTGALAEPAALTIPSTFNEIKKADTNPHSGRIPALMLQYPEEAEMKGWEGDVLLSVLVAPDASIKNVEVVQSSGYKVLDRAAKKAVKQATFKTRGWTEFRIPLHFRLDRSNGNVQKAPVEQEKEAHMEQFVLVSVNDKVHKIKLINPNETHKRDNATVK